MALTDDLISYWKLDEGGTGDAIDAHGANDLSDAGHTVGTDASGIINSARSFVAASTQYFTITDNASLSVNNQDFSVQAWVNYNDIGLSSVVVSHGSASDGYILYILGGDQHPHFKVTGSQGGLNTLDKDFGSAIGASAWHLIHAWHSAGVEICISVDDGTPQCGAYTNSVDDTSEPFQIGAQSPSSSPFNGLIDEVGFWKGRVLSSGERTQLYNGGAGLAYGSFGGGSGTLMGQILT